MKKLPVLSFSFLHYSLLNLNFVLYFILISGVNELFAQSTEIRPGIILPQMTTTQRTALSATNGMLVFDTDTQSYWLRSSGSWTELPKTAANTNFWQQTGLAGNEIKNTNSGGFWSANAIGLDFNTSFISNPPTAPVSGADTRLMWIPSRSAFRVGTALYNEWDAANIGLFSFASGINSTASGSYSTAMGYTTTASGYASTAIGIGTLASGTFSTAMGYLATANGSYSTAMGYKTIADKEYSTVIGKYNVSHGSAIFIVGNGTDILNRKNILTIKSDNDRAGIGEDFPTAPLHVAVSGNVSSSVGSSYSFFYPYSTNFNQGTGVLNADLGIYANYGIVS